MREREQQFQLISIYSFVLSEVTMRAEKLKIFLLILFCCGNSDARVRERIDKARSRPVRACSIPKLFNGKVIPVNRGKMMRFECNKDYSLYGQRYAECMNGRWSLDAFPLCIKGGCPQLPAVANGKISYMNRNASALLFCEPNYEIVGSNFAHCNGTIWDRGIGSCRETDNTPPTSCDFESESICGWTHDADHDFDFERRNGFNTKITSVQTGPSADHTAGIPFHGNYMVIDTNMEVYTKAARLISPLFKIDALKICFEFYFYMYGVSVGTLRVYAKPESVDMSDALVSDEAAEANNDYVIFEIKGTQGNVWKKGNGTIKQFNESFQIIIEAISGQTRLSDIAFDDVSILTDQDCTSSADSNEVDDGKEPEDADGIFDVESCVNRCFEDATVQLNVNKTLTCSCSIDCSSRESCCPDFIGVCMKDDSMQNETSARVPETTSSIFTTTTTTTITTTNTKISSTSSLPTTTTSSPPPPTTSTTVKTSSTTPKVISTSKRMETPQVPQNAKHTTKSDFEELPKNSEEIEDEHEILPEDVLQQSEKLTKEKSQSENSSFILTTLIITVSSVFLATIAITIVYKQYRKSTNPLNYKDRSENGGARKADEEFSEIRYLTSDETLDFTLATLDINIPTAL